MLNVRVKKALLTILTACLTVLMTIGAVLGFTPTPQTVKAAGNAPSVGGGYYEKVTATPASWDGYYLIVYETEKVAFDGSRTTLDAGNNIINYTIENGNIVADDNTAGAWFTINKSGHIKSASGYYIGSTANKNQLLTNKSTTYSNTISFDDKNNVVIKGTSTTLRFNNASGDTNYRFRYYKSGQQAIQLYKWVEEASCDHDESKITWNDWTATDGTHSRTGECACGETIKESGNCTVSSWSEWTSNDDGTHSQTGNCNVCGYSVSETNVKCTYDETNTCACGYKTTEETYTVSFCVPSMEGISEVVSTTVVKGNTIPELPTADAPEGYTFEGWVTKQAISATRPELFDITTKITEDMKLYALYKHEKSGVAKITDVSELKVGMTVVITNADATVAMSTTQNNNNRGQTSIQSSTPGKIEFNENVQRLTLTAGTTAGTFAFKAGNGYLYAASNSDGNYLKTQTTNDANGSWNITFNNDDTASIIAAGSNKKNVMQYNSTSSLFSCYASASQKPLCLYAEGETTITYTTLQFGFANMTLKDELTMNYKVAIDDEIAKDAEMTFTMADNTTKVTGTKVDGLYVYSLQVAPQYMGENITAVLKLGDTVLASKATYSVEQYLRDTLADTPDEKMELKQLLRDLLHYGAAAQLYENHNTGTLVNDGIAVNENAPTTTDFTLNANPNVENGYPVYFKSANLNFSSLNTLYVTLSAYDENVKLVVDGDDEGVELNGMTYSTGALMPTDFDKVYTFELYYGEELMQTLTYSVNAYAYEFGQEGKEGTMADLARALYNYGASVEAYVATLDTQN